MDIQQINIYKRQFLRIASIKDEIDLDVPDPMVMIDQLRRHDAIRIDIFAFSQRIPYVVPIFHYPMEWNSIAALDYKDYKFWFEKILDDKTRNMIRKACKKGVNIRRVDFNEDFVKGIVDIYNETPVRQGRLFKHYGKSFDEVKKANATHLERSEFIGAFYGRELIGFVKLVYGDRTARAEQIISKIAHRDKAPNNALLDEAVKLCEIAGAPYLVYGVWPLKESLAKFKKNNGFKEYRLPRYYVPLNARGRIGIKLDLHRSLRRLVPEKIYAKFIEIREQWYANRQKEN